MILLAVCALLAANLILSIKGLLKMSALDQLVSDMADLKAAVSRIVIDLQGVSSQLAAALAQPALDAATIASIHAQLQSTTATLASAAAAAEPTPAPPATPAP